MRDEKGNPVLRGRLPPKGTPSTDLVRLSDYRPWFLSGREEPGNKGNTYRKKDAGEKLRRIQPVAISKTAAIRGEITEDMYLEAAHKAIATHEEEH